MLQYSTSMGTSTRQTRSLISYNTHNVSVMDRQRAIFLIPILHSQVNDQRLDDGLCLSCFLDLLVGQLPQNDSFPSIRATSATDQEDDSTDLHIASIEKFITVLRHLVFQLDHIDM
jgi:hypothetical protein